MSRFGRYEVVEELYRTALGVVYRAKPSGGGDANFAIKVFQPERLESDSTDSADASKFLEGARIQKKVSEASAGSRWARVLDSGEADGLPFYVTDYFPLSAQKLITGRVRSSPAALYRLISAVVTGLTQLQESAGRAYGNLKPTNVLIAGRGDAVASVQLIDPRADVSEQTFEDDLTALGNLIHLMVLHRPFKTGADWPLEPSPEWSQLGGRCGRRWRDLCSSLLAPSAEDRPANLRAVAKAITPLRPRRRGLRPALLTGFLLILGTGTAVPIAWRQHDRQRQLVDAASQEWLDELQKGMKDPAIRKEIAEPTGLDKIIPISLLDKATSPPAAHLNPLNAISEFEKTRDAADAVEEIRAALSTDHWPWLKRISDLRTRYQEHGWTQPVKELDRQIAAAQPGTHRDIPAAIRSLKTLEEALEKSPQVEKAWLQIDDEMKKLDSDPKLHLICVSIRVNAARDIILLENGLRWPAVSQEAVVALTKDLVAALAEIDFKTPPRAEQFAALFGPDATPASVTENPPQLDDVRELISTRIVQPTTTTTKSVDIVTLPGSNVVWINKAGLKPRLSTRSVKRAWDDWLKINGLEASRESEISSTVKDATKTYAATLEQIDKKFENPAALSPPLPGPYLQIADARREAAIGSLISQINTPEDVDAIQVDDPAREYNEFVASLVKLKSDFDLQGKFLYPLPRPDLDWMKAKPSIWSDPNIQALVSDSVSRLNMLDQAMKKTDALSDRAELNSLAGATTSLPEVAFLAWRRLGSLPLPWPATAVELGDEKRLNDGLKARLGKFEDPQGIAAAKEVRESAPGRWISFINRAATDDAIEQGLGLADAFGVNLAERTALLPATRFNLELHELRKRAGKFEDDEIDDLAAKLRNAVPPNAKERLSRFLVELSPARLKKPDWSPDDLPALDAQIELKIPSIDADIPVRFIRVDPQAASPAYISVNEVSVSQFAGLIAKKKLKPEDILPAAEKIAGPLGWQIVDQKMKAATTWLPETVDNAAGFRGGVGVTDVDVPLPWLRDGQHRFNLAKTYGGDPQPNHPMQQVSAEGILRVLRLNRFRLPTSSEWLAAQKAAAADAKVNLRDATWALQQEYIAELKRPKYPGIWPDAGIFWPTGAVFGKKLANVAAVSDSNAADDSTLYFWPVAPAAASFENLIGNVAEFVIEDPDSYSDLRDDVSAKNVSSFFKQHPSALSVIGGSALSPPQLPKDKPLPASSDAPFSDVGFRLAFSLPSKGPAERFSKLVSEQPYLTAARPPDPPIIKCDR